MSGFLTPLDLEYLDGTTWLVTAPFEYRLGDATGPERVVILKGFITDFASIPRALWNVLPPTGAYGKAAVVHDWLYQHRTVTAPNVVRLVDRAEADRILNEAMAVLGVGRFTRWIIYSGVRVGGWKPWNAYRKREQSVVG